MNTEELETLDRHLSQASESLQKAFAMLQKKHSRHILGSRGRRSSGALQEKIGAALRILRDTTRARKHLLDTDVETGV